MSVAQSSTHSRLQRASRPMWYGLAFFGLPGPLVFVLGVVTANRPAAVALSFAATVLVVGVVIGAMLLLFIWFLSTPSRLTEAPMAAIQTREPTLRSWTARLLIAASLVMVVGIAGFHPQTPQGWGLIAGSYVGMAMGLYVGKRRIQQIERHRRIVLFMQTPFVRSLSGQPWLWARVEE